MEKTNIRIERARKRMSQKDLAEEVGVSRQTIFNIEKGTQDPKVGIALRIAKFFGVKTEDIFHEQLKDK